MKDKSGPEPALNPEVAVQGRCAACSKPVEITHDCVEWARTFNRILAKDGSKPIGGASAALCESCYPQWRVAMTASWRRQHERNVTAWQDFRDRWVEAESMRPMLEAQLLNDTKNDPYYEYLLKEWKASNPVKSRSVQSRHQSGQRGF